MQETWGGLVPLGALDNFFTAIVGTHHNVVCAIFFCQIPHEILGFVEVRQCKWLCTLQSNDDFGRAGTLTLGTQCSRKVPHKI